jgi:Putative peptidoglycan binding domain
MDNGVDQIQNKGRMNMNTKKIPAPHLGVDRFFKMGRKRPKATGPRLKLGRYLQVSLPTPPPSVDYSGKGQPALSNPYLNDKLHDCVIAGGYHIVATETGNADRIFAATDQQIIADYSAIGGYVPGNDSTDQGCDEPTALNYWVEHGFANGTRPLGWLAVDATNPLQLKTALWLFENLDFGVELPAPWLNPAPSSNGFRWDVAGDPDPENGHCIIGVGYNNDGVQVDTWGLIGTVTWAALAKYFTPSVYGSAYVLLTPDQISSGQSKAPNGVSWAALIADFDAMGGNVPPVGPSFNLQTITGIQQALNYLGANPPLVVDGMEGLKTRASIEAFQKAHNLTADGIVGRFTRAALQLALTAAK